MGRHLPQSATLSSETLQPAISGFMKLREMERDEIHRLIFGLKDSPLLRAELSFIRLNPHVDVAGLPQEF